MTEASGGLGGSTEVLDLLSRLLTAVQGNGEMHQMYTERVQEAQE